MQQVLVKWESTGGRLYEPAYPGDGAFDMESIEQVTLAPFESGRVDCGIKVQLPDTVCALVIGRSSTFAAGIMVYPSLIDNGYRGQMFVLMHNLTDKYVRIDPGTRIAQLLPIMNLADGFSKLQQVDGVDASRRGSNGFGSSGKSL